MTAVTVTTPQPAWRRFFGVVARPDTYRRLAFLLLGLPLGTFWFCVLVTGLSVGVAMIVVALIGIPILLGMVYVTRAFANVERAVTDALVGTSIPSATWTAPGTGNPWRRLRAAAREHDRWRELAFLMLRFPVGIATFTVAVTAIAAPLSVAWAPFQARIEDEPFGDWALSSRMEDVATSPWSWAFVPLGLLLLVAALHLTNALAGACGRWAARWLRA